jgi:hypothetical protein
MFRNVTIRHILNAWLSLPLLVTGVSVHSQDATPDTQSPGTAGAQTDAKPPIKRLPDGTLQLGNLRLDEDAGLLEVPGRVNMDRGMIEVLACAEWGKVHESLFVLDCQPYLVQVGLLLLLGLPPGTVGEFSPGQARDEFTPEGPELNIHAVWPDSTGFAHDHAVEGLICTTSGAGSMEEGPWVFTGSNMLQGVFAAQNTGTVVATYVDPDAIVNYAGPNAHNDEAYRICTDRVPPRGTSVTLRFMRAPIDTVGTGSVD